MPKIGSAITSGFSPRGEIDRGRYAALGFSLAAIKYNLDRAVALFVFHRAWFLWNYWKPGEVLAPRVDAHDGQIFYLTLALIAVPFVWTGTCLTIRRLRSAALSPWLVLLFFVPGLNLVLFALLCIVPPRPRREPAARPREWELREILPQSAWGSAAVSVLIVTAIALLVLVFGIRVLGQYGWGIFVGVPFFLGFSSVLLYAAHRPRDLGACLGVAMLSVVVVGLALLAFAMEGLVCLLMALPIGIPLACVGGWIGYEVQRRRWARGKTPQVFHAVAGLLPLLLITENHAHRAAPLWRVTSEVVVDAPPEIVWPRVIAFSEIAPPHEWIFHTGIAFPIRAEIKGNGVGAVRHCVFSTGAFVEPITAWEAPRRLAFDVMQQPPPLQEWSPWHDVHPPHLHDYLRSREGEFYLEGLSGERTLLRGTTWYEHRIWPASYWRVFSDYLIHAIHRRVLDHIKAEAERASALR